MRRQPEDHATRRPPPHRRSVAPGLIVIKWKGDTLPAAAARGTKRAAAAAVPQQMRDPLQYLRDNFGLRRVVSLQPAVERPHTAKRIAMSAHTTEVARSFRAAPVGQPRGVTLVEIDPGEDPRRAAHMLRGGAIEYAEPAPMRWIAASAKPLDARLNEQWGLPAIDWFGVRRPSAAKVHVAVLDTGVDRTHPDLKGAISSYHRAGHSAADIAGHGTHVGGIIAARTNRSGIAGVANCRLHYWKVFGDTPAEEPEMDMEAYFAALAAVARQRNIRVVNLSLGGDDHSRLEDDLTAAVIGAGKVIVAAMGNEYEEGNPIEYPAALPDVIAVGAVGQTKTRRRAWFSNTGSHIALVAPGEGILSTVPLKKSPAREETEYAAYDGTSMATPFVAGVAALICAKSPALTGAQVRDRLLNGCLSLPGMKKAKWSRTYGHGLINLPKCLTP